MTEMTTEAERRLWQWENDDSTATLTLLTPAGRTATISAYRWHGRPHRFVATCSPEIEGQLRPLTVIVVDVNSFEVTGSRLELAIMLVALLVVLDRKSDR